MDPRGSSRNCGKDLRNMVKKESIRLDTRNKEREGATDYSVVLRLGNWEKSGDTEQKQ